MQHAVILPILIPLIVGALLLLPPLQQNVNARRCFSGGGIVLLLLVCGWNLSHSSDGVSQFYLLGNWPAPFGIVLLLDQISALFVALTAVLAVGAFLYSCAGEDERGAYFQSLLQFLLMGINGAFLTADLFNLFVFFEVLLISSYGLLLHGGGKLRTKAGLHYVLLNLLGSAIFLLALALLYGVTGSLNMQDIAHRITELSAQQLLLLKSAAGLLLIVFGLKAAILPLHFWLPSAYAAASPAVAALFAVMTKIGVYCLLRVFHTLFAADANLLTDFIQPLLWWTGLLTLALAAVGVVAAQSLKRLVAYLVLLSVGTMVTVLSIGTVAAVAAVLYYSIHSTLIAAALFLLVDYLAQQRGTVADRLVSARPLANPVLIGCLFFFCAITVIGMPPLSGFVGKIWLLQAATESPQRIGLWCTLLGSSLFVLIALSRAGSTVFWRVSQQPALPAQPSGRQLGAIVLLLLSSLLLVVLAAPVMQFCLDAALQLQANDVNGGPA